MLTTLFPEWDNSQPESMMALMADQISQQANTQLVNLTLGYYLCEEQQCTGFSLLPRSQPDYGQAPSLAILGYPRYCAAISRLLDAGNLPPHATVQTLGATGALSLVLNLLQRSQQCQRVWISELSWENYQKMAQAVGLQCHWYPYCWDAQGQLNFDAILMALSQMQQQDALIIQGCCHNPTGIDFTLEQFKQLAVLAKEKGVTVIIDFAYFGLAQGLHKDRQLLDVLASELSYFFVATSFSKNLGLYSERLGALTLIAHERSALRPFLALAKQHIRANYSMPPQYIAAQVAEILENDSLMTQWQHELATMRNTIQRRKAILLSELKALALQGIVTNPQSKGLFLNLKLSEAEITQLSQQHQIYLLPTGRLSLASLQIKQIPRCVAAIAKVIGHQGPSDSELSRGLSYL